MNIPEELSAKYKETFAYVTVKDRMPVIITNIIDYLCRQKHDLSEIYGKESLEDIKDVVGNLSCLKNHLQTDKEISSIELSSNNLNDDRFWSDFINSYKERNGKYPTWFSASWIFVECFMYRRIDEIFKKSSYLCEFDPFVHLKKNTLLEYEAYVKFLIEFTNEKLKINDNIKDVKDVIEIYVQMSLWGNQCDLSLATTENLKESSSIMDIINSKKHNILAWEFESLWSHLCNIKNSQAKLGLILDNAGVELLSDLCFLTILIKFGFVSEVTLFPKIKPYFVSDTMEHDFHYIISFLRTLKVNSNELSDLWHSFINSKKWIIDNQAFWTGPHSYSEIEKYDPELYKNLQNQSLLIFKGDLNFRKLTSDLDWPIDTPFKTSLCGFHPAPTLSLRTIKGGPVTGLDPQSDNVKEALKMKDWNNFSGDFGLVQFVTN